MSLIILGEIPLKTSGATCQIVHNRLYVFCGFVTVEGFPGNTNDIYCLDLVSKVWTKIQPVLKNNCSELFECDKLSSWTFKNLIYINGGYGNPAPLNINFQNYPKHVKFCLDEPHSRGWNNQLAVFDTQSNELFWPKVTGEIPGPRAAMATVCDTKTKKVYLFGGRFKYQRLNDLYVGDLNPENGNVNWNKIEENTTEISDYKPQGRSWHSMTLLENDRLLIYGGFSEAEIPLNDCWIMDLNNFTFCRMIHFEFTPRLWHTAHFIKDSSSVFLIGGCTKNIFGSDMKDYHPEKLEFLSVDPLKLSQIVMNYIAKNEEDCDITNSLPLTLEKEILIKRKCYMMPNDSNQ